MSRRPRGGAAMVEFAVCLPLMVLLVFGSIEAASFIFLKQSLHVAAYEGARQAVRRTSTTAEAEKAAQAILDSRHIDDASVHIPQGETQSLQRGEIFFVEVSATTRPNSPLAGQFVPNRRLMARVTMVKE